MFYPPRNTILAIALVCNTPAAAHDWYDFECCRKDHCKPVAGASLEPAGAGCWRYKPNGLVYCGAAVKPSKDEGWHVCYTSPAPYLRQEPRPLCVYVPRTCC